MNNMTERAIPYRTLFLLLVVLAGFYWLGNDGASFFDRDEPRFAQPAKEMLYADSWKGWIVPHFNGEAFFHKPPFSYWQIAAAYTVFGVNEFSARFFSGLWTALAAVVMVAYVADRFSKLTGIIAGLTFATSLMVIAQAKLATADATLVLLTIVAVFGLWEIYRGNHSRSVRLALWSATGLAILVKGPTIFVVLVGLTAALLVLDRKRQWIWQTGFLWGIPLALAIGLPWYIIADYLSGGELVGRFVHYDLVARAQRPLESHRGFPGFYIMAAILDAWPWSAFLAPLAVFVWKNRSNRQTRFLLAWLIGPTLIIEFVATKMVHYWLIILPAFVILLAWAIEQWMTDPDQQIWRRWNKPVMLTIGGVWLLIAMAGTAGYLYLRLGQPIDLKFDIALWTTHIVVILGVFVVASSLALYACYRKNLMLAFSTIVFASLMITSTLSVFALPVLEELKVGKQLAAHLKSQGDADTTYVLIGWQEPSTTFYLHPGDRNVVYSSTEGFWSHVLNDNTMIVVSEKHAHPILDQQDRLKEEKIEMIPFSGYNFTRGGQPVTFYLTTFQNN